METAGRAARIDFKKFFGDFCGVLRSKRGDIPAILVFGVLLALDLRAVLRSARLLMPLHFLNSVVFLNGVLMVGYYAMLVGIYLTRSVAGVTTRLFLAKAIAFIATFLPFAVPMLSDSEPAGEINLIVSSLLLFFAMIFTVVALGSLGRNFSLIPQSRKLVTRGPYRLVRHPVYVGEILGALGLTVWAASIAKTLVFLLLVGLEVYRALQEETLLREVFPEYEEYAARTKRFIPGII